MCLSVLFILKDILIVGGLKKSYELLGITALPRHHQKVGKKENKWVLLNHLSLINTMEEVAL